MNLISEKTAIPGVFLFVPKTFGDERGFFMQTYQTREYAEAGLDAAFVQDNMSRSCAGTVRGLHYQLENPQAKLVSVLRGRVLDVAVDIRRGSPWFGQHVAVELSEENRRQFFIPRGFAHGFRVLSESADFFYKCDNFYAPGDEYGIRWNDPALGIDWLWSPGEAQAALASPKDLAAPALAEVPEANLPVYAG